VTQVYLALRNGVPEKWTVTGKQGPQDPVTIYTLTRSQTDEILPAPVGQVVHEIPVLDQGKPAGVIQIYGDGTMSHGPILIKQLQ